MNATIHKSQLINSVCGAAIIKLACDADYNNHQPFSTKLTGGEVTTLPLTTQNKVRL
jgi:hypothetical protein